MRRLRNESGVAMVTVLFIASVLTVVASTAAFVTVQEFRSSADDRRAGRALATAEAGVDRTMLWLRSFQLPYKEIVFSGCTFGGVQYPTQGPFTVVGGLRVITLSGTVASGETYTATVRPEDGVCPTTMPSPKQPFAMEIESTGSIPTAVRKVRQEITIEGRDLPVGLSAGAVDANGNANFNGMSLLSAGPINGRSTIAFAGIDPWYERSDFYPCAANPSFCVAEDGDNIGDMPAAAHSADRIYLNGGRVEHPPNPNCNANRGIPAQSVWDGDISGVPESSYTSACTDQYGRPPTSRFTPADHSRLVSTPRLSAADHQYFKSIAQTSGVYCDYRTGTGAPCTRYQSATGSVSNINIGPRFITSEVSGIGNYYVVYIEFSPTSNPFANSNIIEWEAVLPACSTSNPSSNGMAIVIVNHGSFRFRGGSRITGALFAEDGLVDAAGNYTVEGTVIAREVRLRGTPTYLMTQCWIDLLPGPFMTVRAGRWTEVDR
ncbi:MAG: pilus assembly PilX N-terminal domain-containing protein [Actinomycetota bacterium]